MSRLQLASAHHPQVGVPPRSRDFSTALTIDDATKAPKFVETLSLHDRKNVIDPVPLLPNVVALKRSAMVQFQALSSLEELIRKASVGDTNAVGTLSALIPIATLLRPATTRISFPDVTPKPAATTDVQVSTPAGFRPARELESEAKQPPTKIDKLVTFGDRFDKFLKPIELPLKLLGAVAAATTIGHNLGS
jgi:hypothetical protein